VTKEQIILGGGVLSAQVGILAYERMCKQALSLAEIAMSQCLVCGYTKEQMILFVENIYEG
jgi:hypothetical protein